MVLDAALIERSRSSLTTMVLGLVALFAVRGLLFYVEIVIMSAAGARLLASLRARVLDHLLGLSPRFFSERHTGELISRLTTDIDKVQSALFDRVPDGIRAVVTFCGTVIMLFVLRADLALATLVIVPPLVGIALIYGRALQRMSRKIADATADATRVATEALSGLPTVQAFAQEPIEGRRHRDRLDAVVDLELRFARLRGGYSALIQFVGFGAFAAVLWYGGLLVADGEMSPGELTAFLLYTFSVAGAVGTLGSLYSTLKALRGASARVFEILDTGPDIQAPPNPRPLTTAAARITLEGVTFCYPSRPDHPALRALDLEVEPGEMVALVGPSGGGKSTIFSLLLRFYDPDAGTVAIGDTDVRELDPRELRQHMALVPQDIFLFSGTIADNIGYGDPGADRARIEHAAILAGAMSFIEGLPSGLDEIVGERGIRLSVGQRQRIAIARAFLRQPQVLLLDEATSALDPDSEDIVQRALGELTRGRTTLVIAHRLATARRADRIVVIAEGRAIEVGTHETLQRDSETYRRYWELQSLQR